MKSNRHSAISALFPICLLLVFALTSISIVVFAADTYGDIVKSSSRSNNGRTATAYITEKIHAGDGDQISIGNFNGQDAIMIGCSFNGSSYITYIYHYDGKLKELMLPAEGTAPAGSGTDIAELQDFQATQMADDLLRITCTGPDGKSSTSYAGIRSDK